jgi:hypothetical protein
MSSRFHNKWHRHNHHTDPTQQSGSEPDSTHDPIASHNDPFKGDFVIKTGTLSAQDPNMAGWFSSYNNQTGISLYAVNPQRYNLQYFPYYPVTDNPPNFNLGLAGYFDGNVVVQNALSANSIWSNYISSTYADIDIINVHVSELSGYTISGHYFDLKPAGFNCSNNIGITPHEALVLNGTALSGNTWAAFNGDIITHRDAYVQRDLITNSISGCNDTEIVLRSNIHMEENLRVDGNLYVSGDALGESNVYVDGNLHVSGWLVEPSATNLWVSGSTYTDCILPWPHENVITIGCENCHDNIGNWDPTQEFGVRVCGTLSANAIVGLLNHAQTELQLSETQCFTTPTWNQVLWSSPPWDSEWDGLAILTVEATGSNSYAQVEGYTDNNWVGQMIVGNPGNITNSLLSHPLSAERTLENKQVLTFPLISKKSWSINLIESYGDVCCHLTIYKHVRTVDMTNLYIDQSLYVGGSSIFVGPTQFQSVVDFDCNSAINVGSIEFCDGSVFNPNSGIFDFNCNSAINVGSIEFCDGSVFNPNSGIFDFNCNSAINVGSIEFCGNNEPSIDLSCGTIHNLRAIENNHTTCVDLISSNTNLQITTSGALILPVGGDAIAGATYEKTGAIRYNETKTSFEGFNGSVWAGLGGVIKLNGSGSSQKIVGTTKAFSSDSVPVASAIGLPLSAGDIWFNTGEDVIEYYNGSSWIIFGAAYL